MQISLTQLQMNSHIIHSHCQRVALQQSKVSGSALTTVWAFGGVPLGFSSLRLSGTTGARLCGLSTLPLLMKVEYSNSTFETITLVLNVPGLHVDLPIAPPINVYIVTGCGNGCQASTVHPHMYYRRAIVPLAKEFVAIRRLPSVTWAVLMCLADWAQPLVVKLDAQKFINH